MDSNDSDLRLRVKTMIVQCARLKIAPADMKDDSPLFDREKGLGLDSIDVLELVVNLEKTFGVQVPDRESGQKILQSVNTIVEHIKASGREAVSDRALWEHSRHWLNLRPVYAFGEWMLDSMPLFVGYGLTRVVTELAYRFSPNQRAGIAANVRHVLAATQPGLSAEELDRQAARMVYRIFMNRGIWFADLSLLAGRRSLDGLFTFKTEGCWPALQKQLATGRGAILASAHIGNWHGGGVAMSRHGVPIRVVMYQNHAGDVMDRKVAQRAKVRQTYITSDPLSMMEIVKALRAGEALAMLVDKPWDSRSVAVPFFGKPSHFPVGPVRLARMAGVPIFPAFCVWNETRRYHATIGEPIEVSGSDPEQAEFEGLSKLAKVIERVVTDNLHVWFNFTPAWGTP